MHTLTVLERVETSVQKVVEQNEVESSETVKIELYLDGANPSSYNYGNKLILLHCTPEEAKIYTPGAKFKLQQIEE